MGDGTTTDRVTPHRLAGLAGVTAIATDGFTGYALKADRTIWTWGDNYLRHRAMGVLDVDQRRYTPERVEGIDDVVAISVEGNTAFAIRGDGSPWSWGQGGRQSYGLRGDGVDEDHRPVPAPVPGLDGTAAITQEDSTAYAVRNDGTVWAWGKNGSRFLGEGRFSDYEVPTQIEGLTDVEALATAQTFTEPSHGPQVGVWATKADGSVWTWGINNRGRLGDGTTDNRAEPVQIPGMTDVADVVATFDSVVALRSDGSVWGWGNNDKGQLGDGTTIDRTAPVQVIGLADITSVSYAYGAFVAVRTDGTLWTWGGIGYWDSVAQRHDYVNLSGEEASGQTPRQVLGLADVRVLGECHMLADGPVALVQPMTEPKAKEGCYVATAVYGDYDCPEVRVLRRFRDQSLNRTWAGRRVVQAYYLGSPHAARLMPSVTRPVARPLLDRLVDLLERRALRRSQSSDE